VTANGVLYDVIQAVLNRSLLQKCQTVSRYKIYCNLIDHARNAQTFLRMFSQNSHFLNGIKLRFFIQRNVGNKGVSSFTPLREGHLLTEAIFIGLMLVGTIGGSTETGRRKKCRQEQAEARWSRNLLSLCLAQYYNNLSTVQIILY
jgi:hypothetical protein